MGWAVTGPQGMCVWSVSARDPGTPACRLQRTALGIFWKLLCGLFSLPPQPMALLGWTMKEPSPSPHPNLTLQFPWLCAQGSSLHPAPDLLGRSALACLGPGVWA